MTLTDLLSELDQLSRVEKLHVIQHLAQMLEAETQDETHQDVFLLGPSYEIWSPQDTGGAIATLHKLLQEHRQAGNAE